MYETPEFLRNMQPHRLTRASAARMAVRHAVNPLTGLPTGERYVDPIITSGLERMGYDPAPLVKQLLDDEADSRG